MKIKTWTREGEKTKDAQFSTGSAYTDGIKMNKKVGSNISWPKSHLIMRSHDKGVRVFSEQVALASDTFSVSPFSLLPFCLNTSLRHYHSTSHIEAFRRTQFKIFSPYTALPSFAVFSFFLSGHVRYVPWFSSTRPTR